MISCLLRRRERDRCGSGSLLRCPLALPATILAAERSHTGANYKLDEQEQNGLLPGCRLMFYAVQGKREECSNQVAQSAGQAPQAGTIAAGAGERAGKKRRGKREQQADRERGKHQGAVVGGGGVG